MSTRVRIALAVAVGFVAFAGLVVLASLPTGVDRPEDVVPDGARLTARTEIDGAVVLLVSRGGDLEVQVAYEGPKGWLGVPLAVKGDGGADRTTVARRVATAGGGSVPALTATFGTVPTAGGRVTVTWSDGTVEEATVGSDRTWLAVRPAVQEVTSVVVADDAGVVAEVGRL